MMILVAKGARETTWLTVKDFLFTEIEMKTIADLKKPLYCLSRE